MLGEVKLFAGAFEPEGWMFCDGRVLYIADHVALYSVLGARYGGDGRTTFALPDLRGRVPMGVNSDAAETGLTGRSLGERPGSERVALAVEDLPAHRHAVYVTTEIADSLDPRDRYLAREPSTAAVSYRREGQRVPLRQTSIGETGAGRAHDNVQPALVLHYIIDVSGELPGDPAKVGRVS